jgi:hypothetical protein
MHIITPQQMRKIPRVEASADRISISENFVRRDVIGVGAQQGNEAGILMGAEASAKSILSWLVIYRACAGWWFV